MSQPALADLLAYARAQIGKPYIADANRFGPDHYDCSGFTFDVFRHFGVPLPTTSSADYDYGMATHSMIDVHTALWWPCALLIHGGSTGIGPNGHVVLSAGNGVTAIEAKGSAWGVIEDDVRPLVGGFFTAAMLVDGVPWQNNAAQPLPSPTPRPANLGPLFTLIADARQHVYALGAGMPPAAPSDAVRVIQVLLTHEGFVTTADGRFGPATEANVQRFQSARNLAHDGIVGPHTWAALLGG